MQAPTTAAALIIPSFSSNPSSSSSQPSDKEKISQWVPPPQEKPRERNLVRKVIIWGNNDASFVNLGKAFFCLFLQMTKVSLIKNPTPCAHPLAESSFTQDCLARHNYYRCGKRGNIL